MIYDQECPSTSSLSIPRALGFVISYENKCLLLLICRASICRIGPTLRTPWSNCYRQYGKAMACAVCIGPCCCNFSVTIKRTGRARRFALTGKITRMSLRLSSESCLHFERVDLRSPACYLCFVWGCFVCWQCDSIVCVSGLAAAVLLQKSCRTCCKLTEHSVSLCILFFLIGN